MSQISQVSSDFGGGGSTESGRAVKKLGGVGGDRPPVFVPGAGGDTTGATPGTYTIEPFNPGASAAAALQETEGGLAGLKNSLFGTSQPDFTGHHGGLLGDIPVLGDLTRAGSEAIANVGGAIGAVGKGALDAVGGALEHVDLGDSTQHAAIQRQFDALPDSVQKQQALAAIAKDPGATGHYMAKAINDYNDEQFSSGNLTGKPDLMTHTFKVGGSAAEAIDNLLVGIGLPAKLVQRGFAGLATPGQAGLNRLQLIMAVGDGQAKFNEDRGLLGSGLLAGEQTGGGLNTVEQIVYKKVKSGDWTPDEALDFLTSAGAGLSHSTIANIAGSVALDPSNLAGLGAAGIAKLGATGARLAAGAAKAEEAYAATAKALDAAKAADLIASGLQKTDTAAQVAKLTLQLADDAKAVRMASEGAYKIGEVGRLNPLGQLSHSETATNIVRNMYKAYEPLQSVHIDKALRVARAVVDPLGAMTLHNPFRKQMVDMLSDDAAKTVVGAYGDGNHAALVHKLADATDGASSPLADMFSEDLGTYSANLFRRVVARSQRDAAIATNTVGRLMKKGVNEVLADLGDKVPKSFQDHVLLEANSYRIRAWDDTALANLGERLADNYAVKSADEWTKWLKSESLNPDQLSMLHAATYGRATKRLLAAVEAARIGGKDAGTLKDKLNRLILINRTTLTKQGASGLLSDIENAKSLDAKFSAIEAAQKLYPELRGFTLDRSTGLRSVERFTKELTRKLDAFPSQVVDDELKDLPDDLRAIHTDKTYTLGFAPEDEYKWGLERSNTEAGGWAPIHDVWVDHVAPGLAMGYRTPGRIVETNLAGQPILGAVGKRVGRSIDYIDAGIKTMSRRVSGAVIAQTARTTFVQRAVHQYGAVGITEKVADDMMNALEDAVAAQDIVVRPSGFSTKQMWKAVEDIIPKSIRPADFDKRDLMNLVLDAYQGDTRFVGLTQAFSSRVKRVLAFDSNNASVLAEQVYPNLKYRLNVIFQAQEKIEPWVLNAARGITPARSARTMNDADKATAVLLERMAQRSLVSNADHEMAEYAGQVLHGKTLTELAQSNTSNLGKITKRLGVDWAAIRDVKGVKQINMLRTFRKGLGKELRSAWDQTEPGLFDDMYAEAVRKAGKGIGGLSEDDFAVSIMAEQMLGSGVTVLPSMEGRIGRIARQFDKVDYKAAITPGEWQRPQTLGELKSLGLDDMAELLAFPVGRAGAVTKTQADLRAAIAAGHLKIEDVTDALARLNADPDYISRVRSALEFSWTGFWSQVQHDFNLSKSQLTLYENMIGNAAELRGMTPIDYLSQIMVPQIGSGSTEPVVGHLGQIKELLDKQGIVTNRVPELGQLRVATSAAGSEEQFVGQLASIFSAHLDPSAKRALLIAFKPELEARLQDALDISMETVNRLWTPEMDSELARHILGEINLPSANLGDLYDAGLLRTVADFDRVDPGVTLNIVRPDGVVLPTTVSRFVGDGLRAADPAIQKQVFRTLGTLRGEFPDVPLRHVDIVDEGRFADYLLKQDWEDGAPVAVMVESSDGGSAIILNQKFFGPDWEQAWSGEANLQNYFPTKLNVGANNDIPRETFLGANNAVGYGPAETVRHEVGHSIDEYVKSRIKAVLDAKRGKTKEGRMLLRYQKFRDAFEGSLAHRRLSEYSHASDNEMMAELLALAFGGGDAKAIDAATAAHVAAFAAGEGPQVAPKAFAAAGIKSEQDAWKFISYVDSVYGPGYTEDLVSYVHELGMLDGQDYEEAFSALVDDAKVIEDRLKKAAPDADVPAFGLPAALPEDLAKGPQTVEDAVAQVRTILQDAGVYKPKPVNPDFVAGADGVMPVTKVSPDVIRATQMFGKWTNSVLAEGLRRGADASQAATLEKIAGIPTHMAVPYNFTEHKLLETAVASMQDKWHDAYRLQYYSKSRTMLERSINHPMFGIYPSSYMWGKIMPEMIRFMAKSPFGIRTGAAAYSYLDVQKAVALQREFDPELDKKIEDLGHSQAMFALGYMMPSWPWESSAAWPGWMREFAQEGLDMQARVESGGTVATKASGNGINLQQVAGKAADLIDPVKPIDRAILQPIKEVNPINPPKSPETTGAYFAPEGSGPVPAANLGDPLTQALSSLRDLLGG